jgi:hypothetical protein
MHTCSSDQISGAQPINKSQPEENFVFSLTGSFPQPSEDWL